jgi:hypothetical protein
MTDDSLLLFWTRISEIGFILVIVGVVGESIELLSRLVGWWAKMHFSERAHRWMLVIEFVFWGLLVVGLATEFLGAHKAQEVAERINSRLNKDAAEATKLAAEANQEAARNGLARVQIEKQLLELQAATQWRTITLAQEFDLFLTLKQLPGMSMPYRHEVVVDVLETDFEAVAFAKKIVLILRKCGFDAQRSRPYIGFGDPENLSQSPSGFGVFLNGPTPSPPQVALLEAFERVGLKAATKNYDPNQPVDGIVTIRVWHKPER